MKLYLSIPELKHIRDALYKHNSGLQKELDEKKPQGHALDYCLEALAERDKIVTYVNKLISDNEDK